MLSSAAGRKYRKKNCVGCLKLSKMWRERPSWVFCLSAVDLYVDICGRAYRHVPSPLDSTLRSSFRSLAIARSLLFPPYIAFISQGGLYFTREYGIPSFGTEFPYPGSCFPARASIFCSSQYFVPKTRCVKHTNMIFALNNGKMATVKYFSVQKQEWRSESQFRKEKWWIKNDANRWIENVLPTACGNKFCSSAVFLKRQYL